MKEQLEQRICISPGCNCKFKVLKNSPQNGCSRDHDTRGEAYKPQRTMRRLIDVDAELMQQRHPWLRSKIGKRKIKT